jgi:hypothetical protein
MIHSLQNGVPCRTVWLWLVCQLLVVSQTSNAQESRTPAPADVAQSELTDFLTHLDANKATAAKLQILKEGIQKKLDSDPNAGLRNQLGEREAFATKLQSLRGEATRFVNPVLLPTLDYLVRDAQESINDLKTDLNTRLRAPSPARVALMAQIARVQRDIDLNNKLAKALGDKIKSIQDDRRREAVGSELDALVKMTGTGVTASPPPTAQPDPEKEN